MFAACADPGSLEGALWWACFLTTGAHLQFYAAFGTVLALLALTAPTALALGFAAAVAARARIAPVRWLGTGYMAISRGVPEIAFFLFFVIALDQGIEWLRHQVVCPDWSDPIRQGSDFIVCAAAKTPAATSAAWVHDLYGLALAVVTFALVYGAFAGNVLSGAMRAVPRAQVETALAFGMTPAQAFRRIVVPQMWRYALPGLSNVWMILIKATPLLFLLGVEDIVYWARELGGSKTSTFAYPHPDWRLWYFLALLVFYLGLTKVSQVAIDRLTARVTPGRTPAT